MQMDMVLRLFNQSNPLFNTTSEEILDELKQNSKVKFKETDLFRVYQSIDLVSVEVLHLNANTFSLLN
jgi:hypothetical protein